MSSCLSIAIRTLATWRFLCIARGRQGSLAIAIYCSQHISALSLSNPAVYQSHLISSSREPCLEMLDDGPLRIKFFNSESKPGLLYISPPPIELLQLGSPSHTKMFRPAGRALLRHSPLRPSFARPAFTNAARFLGTAAPKKSNFKSSVVRWALAGGVVYWYATSNVFADEPKCSFPLLPSLPLTYLPSPNIKANSLDSDESTTDDDSGDDRPPSLLPQYSLRSTRKALDAEDSYLAVVDDVTHTSPPEGEATHESPPTHRTGPEELEEEAGQQGAFNPETGEINWDCPCLGGMADGPCGEQFKTAFSCFVFSKEDPKGVDCIDKFKGMQTCFQQVLLSWS